MQKYRAEWEKFTELKDWITPCTTDNTKAFCKFCKTTLNAKLGDLKKHQTRDKHIAASKPFSCRRQQKIPFKPKSFITEQQRREARLCLYVAVHTSISAADHLGEIYKEECPVALHRTKCANLIKNVVGPHFAKSLALDIGNSYFSLIIDESTDITVLKMLGLVIRYFSKSQQKIVSTFLNLVNIEDGTAEVIVKAVKETLTTFNLPLKNLAGIGTDNASTMTGINNGVYVKLKEEVPDLVLVRCVCHSLQLAVSKATERTLPRNMEFLIKETYNWFSHSSLRQLAYQKIYSLINDGELPLKIMQIADTRWLSIEVALKRILDQWESLKTHFSIVRINDNCYIAELLYSMYADVKNKVYLTFLYSVVELVQKTNKSFESRSADPTKLFQDLKNLYISIVSKIVVPGRFSKIDVFTADLENYLDPNPYLGFAFENSCNEYKISAQDKSEIKSRCISFLIQLAKELRSRLPENLKILEKINQFSVSECLKHNKQSIVNIITEFTKNTLEVTQIENQWSKIHLIQWQETQNTELFWIEVNNYRDASNENPFKPLVELAFRILCFPHSNADVERVFSAMNFFKNKLRNRMKLSLLNNLLYIRFSLKNSGHCCNTYVLPDNIIKQFGKKDSYNSVCDGELFLQTDTDEMVIF